MRMTPERIAELKELYDPAKAPFGSGKGCEAMYECLDEIQGLKAENEKMREMMRVGLMYAKRTDKDLVDGRALEARCDIGVVIETLSSTEATK